MAPRRLPSLVWARSRGGFYGFSLKFSEKRTARIRGRNKSMMENMTPEKFEEKMRSLISGDEETDHCRADDLMCELLIYLGYQAGVKVFEDMDKWYA